MTMAELKLADSLIPNHKNGGDQHDDDPRATRIEEAGHMRQACVAHSRRQRHLLNPDTLIFDEHVTSSCGEHGRNHNADLLHKAIEVSRPARGHRGGRPNAYSRQRSQPIIQATSFAEGGVAVSVGRAGDGNDRGELGVAKGRQRRR